MNATSITMSTTPGNQTYAINQATLLVDLPTYTWFPTQSSTTFTYAITSGPSFVTIAGSPAKIQIFTDTPSHIGTYSVSIETTETNSGLKDTKSFSLLVTCVSAIAPAETLNDEPRYLIFDPTVTWTQKYDLTPSFCINELVLTVTLIDGSPLPDAITYTAPSIYLQTDDPAMANEYTVKVVATDPKTGITNSDLTFTVTIKCTRTISVQSNPIPATIIYILDPNSLNTLSQAMPIYE
jgi:hypothetical protein